MVKRPKTEDVLVSAIVDRVVFPSVKPSESETALLHCDRASDCVKFTLSVPYAFGLEVAAKLQESSEDAPVYLELRLRLAEEAAE